MHGHDVIAKLRAAGTDTPVLVLSGQVDLDSIVNSLRSGADDFLAKPYNFDELAARVHAVARRSRGNSHKVITAGKISVSLDARSVKVSGKHLPLTNKEFQVLELLSLRKGKAVSRHALLNHLYLDIERPDSKVIDAYIYSLRKKLRSVACGKSYVKTVRGRGFMLSD